MSREIQKNVKQEKLFEPLSDSMICMAVGIDLTYEAQGRRESRAIGRDQNINKIMHLLCRQGLRNVIITGDAGVGKTSVVEELALRITQGRVPARLKKTRIIQTSFGDIWGYVADSENWAKYLDIVKKLIEECKEHGFFLFIDEIHTVFGHQYTMQYLRPHLANGSITIIGATTDQEYYTYLNKDRVTMRRFQIHRLEETNENTTLDIVKSVAEHSEPLYGYGKTKDDELRYLIKLSNAYIPYQFQPAKALNILDQIAVQKSVGDDKSPISKQEIRKAVAQAVGIPEEAITAPKERLAAMEHVLNAHILGQKEAISKLCRRLFISKSSVSVTPERPDGVFLLAGPTGVGKTELAKALSAYLTGNEKNLIRIDMNAYADQGSIYAIIGMPGRQTTEDVQSVPLLTQQLRARPYSVLLLDEIEKAHPSVRLLFLHAFDTGRMVDNLGNEIYMRNTVVIITTNLGFSVRRAIINVPGQDKKQSQNEYERTAMETIKESFPKEFLGRVDELLIFKPLTPEIMRGFVKQKIKLLESLVGKHIEITEGAISLLCEKGFHPEYGARDLNRAVDDLLGYEIAVLKHSVNWDDVKRIQVDAKRDKTSLEVKI